MQPALLLPFYYKLTESASSSAILYSGHSIVLGVGKGGSGNYVDLRYIVNNPHKFNLQVLRPDYPKILQLAKEIYYDVLR